MTEMVSSSFNIFVQKVASACTPSDLSWFRVIVGCSEDTISILRRRRYAVIQSLSSFVYIILFYFIYLNYLF